MADDWSQFREVKLARTRATPTPAPVEQDDWSQFQEVPASAVRRAGTLTASGKVHDGDTFALTDGRNARLYGVDAFELNQIGRASDGSIVPLGQKARGVLAPYATPDATVTPTGALTYGRPVASLDNGGDAGKGVLSQGYGIATPEYLKSDPIRLNEYMEAERFARQNRRGAWSTQFEQPANYRHKRPEPWAAAELSDTPGDGKQALFWDEPTPFQGLRPDVASGYAAIFQDMTSKPEDLLAYAKANGFTIDEADTRKRYAIRAKTGGGGGKVTYKDVPRVLTDPGDGKLGAFARGVADPINALDEMGAVVDSLVPNDRENVWDSDRRFGDIYANNLDQNRSVLAYDDSVHPYMRFGGQLASGVLLPGASVEGVGAAAARKVLEAGGTRFAAAQAGRTAVVGRLATAGAVEGGLAGVGAGEDAKTRVQGGLIGAPAGAVLGALAGTVAPKVAQLVGRPFNKLAGREGEAAAQDFTDGAIDTARARASNDISAVETGGDLPAPVTIDRAALHAASGDDGGFVSMAKAGVHLREQADAALARGDTVTLHVEGKSVPITQPGLTDASGQRRGAMPILSPSPGQANRLEIQASAPTRRAMENETPAATLVGPEMGGDAPRTADMIDVNDRARPRLDTATTAERRAQAADIAPGDVLPLPANRVADVDEAASIDAGRIEPVRAPDEMAELSRRNLPSPVDGTRTIPKRGPVDLVTYLRTQGGLRGEGGELQHLGIDNAPRKGMDFAGGEQRFGRLVDKSGMGYDEAATRAWEAGYFPDHAEPPTIPEFIEALDATHSGRNRSFLPDDLEEVDRFAAARQQRYDVEAAAQEGDPLYQDRSEPVTEADLDAMSAPVTAYEEWGENAPRLAGNLRLDKLDSPESIKRALAATHARVGGFDASTRGRITQAETTALADDLGMTADDLLKRRKGQAFNAEEALAARQILAKSAAEMVRMARRIAKIETPGDEAEAAFREAWLRHAAIQEQVAGMTAEAGRLLQQFRMTADGRDARRALSVLGDGLGGPARAKEVAERIIDLENVGVSPAGINQFALRSLIPRWRDKAVELYINSLLSGPQTHAVNMLSNTLTALGQLPEHLVAAGIGAARRAIPSQRDTDRVLFTELGSRGAGMLVGAKEGLRAAARSFVNGDAIDGITKIESQQANAIGGRIGTMIRTPTRLLTAEDELFKGIARRMELNGLAMRQARREGLTGAAARDRAGELAANASDVMLDRSFNYARYLTFQTPLEPSSIAAGVSRRTQSMPVLKLVFPFIRTPMNLLRFAAERSPAAVMMKSWRKEIMAGGSRRDLALARAMVGSGFGAVMYEAAVDGRITGSGPADNEARRLLQADGWQPYSFKIGDRYFSYARLDPFSTTIGTVADMVDLQSHMTERQQERSFTLIAAAMANNLSSKTWLEGLSGALEAITEPQRYMDNYLSRTAGSIAVPSFVAQLARIDDPVMREARGPIERIKSRIPGMSEELPARRDAFGQTITSEGGVGPDIVSPLWTGTRKNDPTVAAMLEAGAHVTAPRRKIGDRDLTPAEYERYSAEVGRIGKPMLDDLVRSPDWATMDQDDQQEAVTKTMKAARKATKPVIDSPTLTPTDADDPWSQFQEVR